MIWWGHELSCTIHLAGESMKLIGSLFNTELIAESDIYVCVGQNPWEYHFDSDNYRKVKDLETATIDQTMEMAHFKISYQVTLPEIGNTSQIAQKCFLSYLDLLS